MPVDSKISELTAASALAGTEEFPIVQSGVTVKSTPNALKTFMQTGLTMAGALISADGTAALPGVGIGSNNKGLYEYSANVVGFSAGGVGMGGFYSSGYWVETTATYADYLGSAVTLMWANTTAGLAPEFSGNRSRGTIASKTVIIQNDQVVAYYGRAWDGAAWKAVSLQLTTVTAATPSATDMQSRMQFYLCAAGSAIITEILRIEHATGLSMFGANVVIDQNRIFRLRVYTVATLPAAGTAGRTAAVSDATAPTYLGALTGGGAVSCPVYDNGAAWVSG